MAGDLFKFCLGNLGGVKVGVITPPDTTPDGLEFHADQALAVPLLVMGEMGPF
jgi:hypothetical protein